MADVLIRYPALLAVSTMWCCKEKEKRGWLSAAASLAGGSMDGLSSTETGSGGTVAVAATVAVLQ